MAKKNNAGIGQNILKILLIIPAIFSLTSSLISQAHLEAVQLKRSVVLLVVLTFFFFILMLSMWFCALGWLVLYLLSLNVGMMLALSLVFIFNLFLLIITCLVIRENKIDPSFPETRKVIKDLISS
tara:strand:- start:971 stop:1348 length:378 start_codon:yes stop_codon:yes gene_type:complete